MMNRLVIILGLFAFAYCQYQIYLIEIEFQAVIASGSVNNGLTPEPKQE